MMMRSVRLTMAVMVACLALTCSVRVYAEDKDRDNDRDAEKMGSVRLPGSKIVLFQGMSDDQVKSAFLAGAVAMDNKVGTGMANVKASFGEYMVTLSSVQHALKGFAVSAADAGASRTGDALKTWFDTGTKHLKNPQHKTGTTESGIPNESWSTPEIEWSIWTVVDKPTNLRHPVYHVTFTAAMADDDD
jgi:hypothetical protein